MKVSLLLPLAAASSAFVSPDQEILGDVQVETGRAYHRVSDKLENAVEYAGEVFDDIAIKASDHYEEAWASAAHWGSMLSGKVDYAYDTAEDMLADVEAMAEDFQDLANEHSTLGMLDYDEEDEDEDEDRPPHHRRPPHKRPHKPSLTVYQMIAKSKYTTKLASFINEYPDLVKALNGTKANYTVFAFSDRAFEKLPEHYKKPSKETLEKALSYHVSPEFYPAGRILVSRTIPTLLDGTGLGKGAGPQRLGTEISLRGLTVNYYSRVFAANIFGTNGVIHGIDTPLLLPPMILDIVNLLPGTFSTLELGIFRTDLIGALNATDIKGATLFAPTNFAFQKLGPATNAFLFSHYGLKYLKALIKYHVAPKKVLYSDAYYKAGSEETLFDDEAEASGIPRGSIRVEVPTLLEGKTIVADYRRYGRLIDIRLNGLSRVSAADIIAQDGVVHEIDGVLIPPRKLANGMFEEYDGESEMSPEELMERLDSLEE